MKVLAGSILTGFGLLSASLGNLYVWQGLRYPSYTATHIGLEPGINILLSPFYAVLIASANGQFKRNFLAEYYRVIIKMESAKGHTMAVWVRGKS